MIAIGFDTSNYTTSIACFDGVNGRNCSRLLPVKPGELGLRQSDALFAHVKQLPTLAEDLTREIEPGQIAAIGVSTRPRAVEGSYMPCFLAGETSARILASTLHVPLYAFSHQQGHIAAVLWSAGRTELLTKPHLAWHLSGGTTELLLVGQKDGQLHAEKIGGTTDISAGQLIDRTGKLLGCAFPSGKAIDALATGSDRDSCFKIKHKDFWFSLSGMQNQVEAFYSREQSPNDTARFALLSVARLIQEVTKQACRVYSDLPVVFSGGVASNTLLRRICTEFDAVFAPPEFSTDNAMGIAYLTWLQGDRDGR